MEGAPKAASLSRGVVAPPPGPCGPSTQPWGSLLGSEHATDPRFLFVFVRYTFFALSSCVHAAATCPGAVTRVPPVRACHGACVPCRTVPCVRAYRAVRVVRAVPCRACVRALVRACVPGCVPCVRAPVACSAQRAQRACPGCVRACVRGCVRACVPAGHACRVCVRAVGAYMPGRGGGRACGSGRGCPCAPDRSARSLVCCCLHVAVLLRFGRQARRLGGA